MNSLRLYFRFMGVSIRGQMQYRATFVMLSLGHLVVTGIEFLGVLALFHRFGNLKGWSLPEVALLYGMVSVAFSFSDAAARGFDIFAATVRRGDFDRVLLRPRGTALQLAGQELTLRRVGRLLQGAAVLFWAASTLHIVWTPAKLLLLIASLFGAASLFYGIVVLQATLCFWTVESLELFNILTYGGVQTTQYPMDVYQPWFRRFFTYVIPLAAVNYLPVHAILERTDTLGSTPLIQWLSPLAGIGFLIIALQVWRIGVRHYCSTGS